MVELLHCFARLTKTCIPPLCKILKIRNEFHGGRNVGKGQSHATEASYEEIKSGNATGRGFSFLMSQNRFVQKLALERPSACANVRTTVSKMSFKISSVLYYGVQVQRNKVNDTHFTRILQG